MNRAIFVTLGMLLLAGGGCGDDDAKAQGGSSSAAGGPDAIVKISEKGYAQYCSLAVGSDGTLHAVYTDSTATGKPHYVYYRASKDNGATWTEPKNLSDDESGLGSSWCQVKVDGSGRAYAIWKYIDETTALDGPGGNSGGILAIRCLDGGNWSKAVRFGDKHQPMTSWFAANGPDGKVSVIWAQVQPDVDLDGRGSPPPQMANNLSMATFEGGAAPKITPIFIAKPLPTKAEIEAAHQAGKDLTWEEQNVRPDGLWNLRGYIAADGKPHFVAEKYHATSQDPTQIVMYDGQKVAPIYDYVGYLGYNTFNWPPMLVHEADGKDHLVRKPEKSEHELLRDYPMDGGKPCDASDAQQALTNASETTKIFNWNVSPLEGGRVAAMAALSPKGMYDDANDLYLAVGDGHGKWTTAINVTDNDGRAKAFSKGAVSQSSTYMPEYAEAAVLKDGEIGVLMVDTEHSISGLNTVAITGSGTAVTGTSTFSTNTPYVFFTKVKGS